MLFTIAIFNNETRLEWLPLGIINKTILKKGYCTKYQLSMMTILIGSQIFPFTLFWTWKSLSKNVCFYLKHKIEKKIVIFICHFCYFEGIRAKVEEIHIPFLTLKFLFFKCISVAYHTVHWCQKHSKNSSSSGSWAMVRWEQFQPSIWHSFNVLKLRYSSIYLQNVNKLTSNSEIRI